MSEGSDDEVGGIENCDVSAPVEPLDT